MSLNKPKIPILRDVFKIKLRGSKKKTKTQFLSSSDIKQRNKNKKINNNNKTSLKLHLKKDISTYIKEKEYENLIKNYLNLKHEIFIKEKEDEKKAREEESKKQLKFNYSTTSINKFDRDKHKIKIRQLIQGKKGIVTTSKTAHDYKMNSVLEKIWTKFHEELDEEKNFDNFLNVFAFSKDAEKRFINKINNRSKDFKSLFDIKIESVQKKFGINFINDSNRKINDKNTFENSIIVKRRLKSANTISKNQNNCLQNLENTSSTNINGILNSSSIINNNKSVRELKNQSNKNIPFLSKIKKINKINMNSSTSKIKSKKIIYKLNSAKKRAAHSVKNMPMYTLKISDLVHRYNKIKNDTNIQRSKYLDNNYLTYDKMNSIIETKEDLLMFVLKRKFLENKFPPKKHLKIKENKRNNFIKKIKSDFDFLDKPFDLKI